MAVGVYAYGLKTRNEQGQIIHNEWLKRNEWAKGSELDIPFEKLTLDEQEKDIAQLKVIDDICTNLETTGSERIYEYY